MKILHFKTTMRLEEGGVVKAVLDLVRMSASTDEVGLASIDSSGLPDDLRNNPSITVHDLGGKVGRGGAMTQAQISELSDIVEQYDVVHLHSMWTTANPQLAKICKAAGKPYVLSVHGMLDDWCMSQRKLKKVMYLKTWGRNLLRDADVVHCTAQAELDQASAWFEPSKGMIVPLPFDLDEYKDLPDTSLAYESFDQLDESVPKVLFLSRIHYKKGVDRLIRASAVLADRGVKHQLVIAGTGDEPYVKEMQQLASECGVQDHTYFLGFAAGQPKVALFCACDMFALPTSQENFGFVFFEALAAGTTVVTTKGTDTWPEIEQSGGGVIVENTPEAFADAIEERITDLNETHSMGLTAREWVYNNMTVDQIRASYQRMYAQCHSASSATSGGAS